MEVKSSFSKEYNILKIYSLFLAMRSMPATKRNIAILCAQDRGNEKNAQIFCLGF
jgi:hypothetical protein